MRSRVKAFIVVLGVLLVVIAAALITISRRPLYGQAEEENWIPNMVGVWERVSGAAIYFADVTDPSSMPQYVELTTGDPEGRYFHIMQQNGRLFDAEWDGRKMAGVIMQDRTVFIQMFEPSENRFFITGKIMGSGAKPRLEGYSYHFADFGIGSDSDKSMSIGYASMVKID